MGFFSVLLSILFSSNLWALDVLPFGETIQLSSESCSETESIVKTLEAWTKLKCQKLEGCKYDIKRCLPAHIAGVVGKYSGYEGPNCWNLALVMRGILPGLRFSTKEEMAFYLNSPLCRNLKMRKKDVQAMWELLENYLIIRPMSFMDLFIFQTSWSFQRMVKHMKVVLIFKL